MKAAVLSDTHGLLRPEVLKIVDQCQAVIHAGDINRQEIVERLGQKSPLYIVRGNNDKEWAGYLPLSLEFELEGVRFFMVHNKKDIPGELGETDVVIFGHSHKYFQQERDGRLWLNPGSCGRRRFNQAITMAVMEIEEGKFSVQKIEFDHETGAQIPQGMSRKDMSAAVISIMKGMERGESVGEMAERLHLEKDLTEQICRIIVTHPGVTAEGILNKMEVNHLWAQPHV